MSKLAGQVTTHGAPATSAVVELHNATGDVVDQVQVDNDGRYTFHLTGGTWKLNVWDAHGHRGSADVDLGEDDATCDVDLDQHDH